MLILELIAAAFWVLICAAFVSGNAAIAIVALGVFLGLGCGWQRWKEVKRDVWDPIMRGEDIHSRYRR